MPRRERSTIRTQSILGAAKNYTIGRSAEKVADSRLRPGEDWQRAAWDFFDMVPEYHQACILTGSLLSRAKLEVLEQNAEGVWEKTTNETALSALDELFGGDEGQVEMLRQFGIHFSVAGGGFLVGPSDDKDLLDPDKWLVAAATEISKSGTGWKLNGKQLDGNPIVVEIWRRHPRNPKKYDAPTRAILPILSELLQLTKRIAAQIDSRLTGAGVLFIPSETSFPSQPTRSMNPGDPEIKRDALQPGDAQGLAELLYENARLATSNPESAEAQVPIIASTPGEYIDKVQLINFWSELDKSAPKLREELIRRIALGMDLPADVLLGNAGANHWNAWLSDENSVKVHAEPLLKVLTTSLTTGYLRKALEGESDIPDVNRFMIGADTSQMRLRPNRSKEALELNRDMKLSDAAALRENGFDPADMMDGDGIRMALLRKVASGSTTPELVEAALRELGAVLDVQVTDTRPPAEARPAPSLQDHPVRELPEQNAAAAHAIGLTFAAEQMIDRALQRAGNRAKTKYAVKSSDLPANRLYMGLTIGPKDVDDLLIGAWDCTREFDYGVQPAALERALDMYTRSLLISRREPSRPAIAATLKLLLDRSAA